ncbi:hypothetical protein DEJ36_13185 [Curtobacterium sp. MCPF17_052]|nr:hypothetical protein [Curtobacterium sp. MCPF17_052]WIB11828.1 hypothetical protein DEJ36_13185 [Curtobacterium sp. MCPF17_052]
MKRSVPENPSAGVYVYEPSACRSSVPCAGARSTVAVSPVPRSLARTPSAFETVRVDPAVAVALSGIAIGPTTTMTVAVADCPEASVTVYVTVSVPENPGCGV